jgi:NAD(P)-dependent dehydrogenase (short-subunit alcohol dehydrogenase family)
LDGSKLYDLDLSPPSIQLANVRKYPAFHVENGRVTLGATPESKRVALITGANKGIGFETARQLGPMGITVLIGSREQQRGQTAVDTLRGETIDAQLLILDVADQLSIDRAAADVERQFGKLDILVNNAGILLERIPPSQCQIENLRKTLATNVVGLFAVTKAFLPLLRRSPSARIVNVSSALGSLSTMGDPQKLQNEFLAYSSSKAAVNMITVVLARELAGTKIKVNAAAPGYTATAMNNFSGTQTVPEGAIASVKLATLPEDGPTGAFFDKNGPVAW